MIRIANSILFSLTCRDRPLKSKTVNAQMRSLDIPRLIIFQVTRQYLYVGVA